MNVTILSPRIEYLMELFNYSNGVKQGSVISPLFFNVYMNNFSFSINGPYDEDIVCK